MRAVAVALLFVFGIGVTWLFRPINGAHPTAIETAATIRPAEVASRVVELALDPARDAGRKIEIATPSRLQVHLDAIPATGHRWEVAGDLPNHLRLASSVFLDSDGAMPGATKRQQLTFEVLSQGRADITLVYRQPWNQSDQGSKRFTFTIIAK